MNTQANEFNHLQLEAEAINPASPSPDNLNNQIKSSEEIEASSPDFQELTLTAQVSIKTAECIDQDNPQNEADSDSSPEIEASGSDESSNKSPKTEEKRQIKLLTYNIFMRPPFINNNGNDYKNERLLLIAKQIEEFDIVNFQEIFSLFNFRRSKLIKHSKKNGFRFACHPPSQPLLSTYLIDSGLLTLSKHKILVSKFKNFKSGAGIDGLVYKGILYTKIDLYDSGKILHLYNIHTNATYSVIFEESQRSHFEARLNQLTTIRDVVEGTLKLYSNLDLKKAGEFKDLILVGGDFNIDARNRPVLPKDISLKDSRMRRFISQLGDGEELCEYDLLKHCLSSYGRDKVVDLLERDHEKEDYTHPVTYGDVEKNEISGPLIGTQSGSLEGRSKLKPLETVLTCKEDWGSQLALDLILQILPGGVGDEVQGSCKVREFFVEGKKFGQLSDHYGVELCFEV